MRIVSLLPSATEIVCSLGLAEQLVGVTHECDYPPEVRHKPHVTRSLIPAGAASAEIDALVRDKLATERVLYRLEQEVLAQLEPELIVTQALCDVCAVAEAEVQQAACSLPGQPRVINLEPENLAGVLDCVTQVAEAAGIHQRGQEVRAALAERVQQVRQRSESIRERPRVVLLEWIDPPFSSGHWSPELVELAGGREMLGVAGQRSRTMTWDDVLAARPNVLFIACCGFDLERTAEDLPILARQPGWQQLPCVESDRVFMVDGSAYFSRPGPRLVDSLEILAHALHPDRHPLPTGIEPAVRLRCPDLVGSYATA